VENNRALGNKILAAVRERNMTEAYREAPVLPHGGSIHITEARHQFAFGCRERYRRNVVHLIKAVPTVRTEHRGRERKIHDVAANVELFVKVADQWHGTDFHCFFGLEIAFHQLQHQVSLSVRQAPSWICMVCSSYPAEIRGAPDDEVHRCHPVAGGPGETFAELLRR